MYTAEFSKVSYDNFPVHFIYPNNVTKKKDQFEFVLIYKNGIVEQQLGINLHYNGLPFRQIEFWKEFISIGLEDIFILPYKTSKVQLINKCIGYFGHIYVENEYIFVSTAYNIMCYNDNPEPCWISDSVAIDGVLIDKIDNNIIKGSGQCDPPDGWRDFTISTVTGKIVTD